MPETHGKRESPHFFEKSGSKNFSLWASSDKKKAASYCHREEVFAAEIRSISLQNNVAILRFLLTQESGKAPTFLKKSGSKNFSLWAASDKKEAASYCHREEVFAAEIRSISLQNNVAILRFLLTQESRETPTFLKKSGSKNFSLWAASDKKEAASSR